MSQNLNFKIELSKHDVLKKLKLPNNLSSDLAYLCGILVGDGSIYNRENKNEYVIKCVGNPLDEKELYYQVIGPKFKKIFGFMPRIGYYDSRTTFGFTIYSKTLFLYLTNVIGLLHGKKDERLRIPEIIKYNKKLLVPFIRGLFDTDGCIFAK